MADQTRMNPHKVICSVPIELVFTDIDVKSSRTEHRIDHYTDAWFEHHLLHSNISIMRFRPHRDLYSYFMGQQNSAEAYLEWHDKIYTTRGLKAPDREMVLRQKQKEFINMKNELLSNSSFFMDHPIQARYNPAGYFNIKDGHHRAAFLYVFGFRRVYLEISSSDYEQWLNADQAEAVRVTIQDQQRQLIYTPILHPDFYFWSSERDHVYPTRLDYMMRYLGLSSLRGARVVDIGCNIGYHARCFTREGAVVTGVEHDADHCRMLKELNDLEHTHFQWIQESFENASVGSYDIGIMLTVFYHVMKNEEVCRAFLDKLDQSVEQLLFWESGDDPQKEKRLILEHTGFTRYEKLAGTFGTGKLRELGVFQK
ncbi:class I SAM-dependent methyltransferase [Paenibacillus lactis]|uniref:class I SAM-dependent methyltransferase n=1 Tax=Paenibacillus lactis TaxID=228574 RepID=UPI001B13CC48|nr:class I SAM-dependent methyltransferase [Paenibacillus lactis]GIO89959.1 hypothetical protein J31TS3_11860 [Paenibacillus lactis]